VIPKNKLKLHQGQNCMTRPAQKSTTDCYFSSAQERMAKKKRMNQSMEKRALSPLAAVTSFSSKCHQSFL
jgi:hypothetical protein